MVFHNKKSRKDAPKCIGIKRAYNIERKATFYAKAAFN